MLKRIIYNGMDNINLGFKFNKIYKGKEIDNKLVVWNDFEEEILMNEYDFIDITSSLRLTPYNECLVNYETLIKGELYQVILYRGKLNAIDSNNNLVQIKEDYIKEYKSINIDLFSS